MALLSVCHLGSSLALEQSSRFSPQSFRSAAFCGKFPPCRTHVAVLGVVRKRTWAKPNGETGEAWVADYRANGKRHIKTFKTRREAVAFSNRTGVEASEGRHVANSLSITV